MTRPEWQSSPNVASPTEINAPRHTEIIDLSAHSSEPTGLYRGSRRTGTAGMLGTLRRPGPVALAAIAAGVLVIFGIGALVVPPLLSGGSSTTAPGGNAAGAAPPPDTEISVEPSTEATAEPSAEASPTPSAKVNTTPTAAAGNARFEEQVLALVNNERRRARCEPVRMDDRLRTAARAHSADMARTNNFDHTGSDGSSPLDRMREAGYPQGLSENIARGQDSPQEVMRDWLRDRGDRANILNCDAKAMGIGVAFRGRTPFWTQTFGRA